MKADSYLGILMIAAFGFCFLGVCVDAECNAAAADHCLDMAHPEQLPSTDKLDAFCLAAVALSYNVSVCLKNCNFTASITIQDFNSRINKTCPATPDCLDLVSQYSVYASCFDTNGGLQSVLDSIVTTFNARESTDILCRSMSSGRFCQKSATEKCPLLKVLDQNLYNDYQLLAAVQHICGSENVPDLVDSSTCNNSDSMASDIEGNCNIGCSIAATPDPVTICAFLQDQANCILRYSQGCTQVERRYLLPRLNTYAILNLLLPCSTPIQVRGINVQPTGLSPNYPENFRCSYIPQINACFQLELSDSIRADALEKLFNGNFLLDQFCRLQSGGQLDRQKLLAGCEESYLRCRLPVAEVYDRPSGYDISYVPSLGPFPLDPWGLIQVLSSLTCPNPRPPTLCPTVRQTVLPTKMTSLRPTPAATRRTTPLQRPMTPTLTRNGTRATALPEGV